MIVNVAGTSGSGKSHLMRSFFNWVQDDYRSTVVPHYAAGRKIPMGYEISNPDFEKDLYVIGSYESPTGGCDTIRDVVKIFDIIVSMFEAGVDVLYEGLFVMNMTRGPDLVRRLPRDEVVVLQLTTPLSVCYKSIDRRRAERGESRLVTRKNTKGNHIRTRNYASAMRDAGAIVYPVSRDEAFQVLLHLLGKDDGQEEAT